MLDPTPLSPYPAAGGTSRPLSGGAGALRYLGALELCLIGLLALAVRLIGLYHTPFVDEMNHVLAAHSLLERGTLQIGEGAPYNRAALFTYLVAGLFRLFGESLATARIPAVLGGVGLVVAVFLWVRAEAGRAAAWIAALLLCFSPGAIYLSQQVRFYTLQALFFWMGAMGVYHLATRARPLAPRTGGVALASVALFAAAFYLQPVTAVGIAAVLLWLLFAAAPALRRAVTAGRFGAAAVGAGFLLGGVALAYLLQSGAFQMAVGVFQHTDLWAEGRRENPLYYHELLLEQYATLWTLFPLALLAAALRNARAALFCAMVFGIAFVFHSVAAWKAERYLFYAFPFFFAVVGMGGAQLVVWVRRAVPRLLAIAPAAVARGIPAEVASAAILGGAVLFAAAGNGAAVYTFRMLTTSDAEWRIDNRYRGEADWAAAAPRLAPLLRQSSVLLASSNLKALYFLGRLDFDLSLDQLAKRGRQLPEFALSGKTARPVISTPESLRRVIECRPTGLVVVEQNQWRTPWGVRPGTADYLVEHTQRVPLPESNRLLAFRWSRPAGYARPGASRCAVVNGRRPS